MSIGRPVDRLSSEQSEQYFSGVKQEARQTADQRAIEADVLKILSDIDLDQIDQPLHIPSFDLIGDENRDAPLLFNDDSARDRDDSVIDLGAHLRFGGEMSAGFAEKLSEAMLQN